MLDNITTTNGASPRIDVDLIRRHANDLLIPRAALKHEDVLTEILSKLESADFRTEAKLDKDDKITQRHYCVVAVQQIVAKAKELRCGLCKNQELIYAYNGQFWRQIDADDLKKFLGEAAEKLGVEPMTARYFQFRDALHKQFLATSHLPMPRRKDGLTLINLLNGTFEISATKQLLREHRREDFLAYQLPFSYTADAHCSKWQAFLDEVLPDKSRQDVCAEFVGYTFTSGLKLEKVLLPYGGGANGKSVFFDVISALLGAENICHFSLSSLGHEYNRAKLANKLLNYASEISTRLESETLKKLASGEPVEARLPYGQPFILTNYAKLAFNCNELPRDVEHTNAFFRRFLIVPFEVQIEENKQNPNLAQEIIASELPGVFNWVLEGLRRLLKQKKFTECEAVKKAVAAYRKESDSVATFLDDEGYEKSADDFFSLKSLYPDYRAYCADNGYKALGRNNFSKRLEVNGFTVVKKEVGRVVYLTRA